MLDDLDRHARDATSPLGLPIHAVAYGSRIGLRATVRHYYDFGADREIVGTDLGRPDSWDRLRAGTSGAFSMPSTREEFVEAAEARRDIAARARAIDAWLDDIEAGDVASYGVGAAILEWWLNRISANRTILCTDYAAATVKQLDQMFPALHVRRHDLRYDEPLVADVHLFHRIDTELSDPEWHDVFRRFGSERILILPAGILDFRDLLVALLKQPLLRLRGATRAGFVRTRGSLDALWRPTHSARALRMHDLDTWFLTPRELPGFREL